MTHPPDDDTAPQPADSPSPTDEAPPSPPIPTGSSRSLGRALLIGVVALGLGVAAAGPIRAAGARLWNALAGDATPESDGRYYTCGMHPWVILPHPGDCPICHMELTPIDPKKFSGEVTISPLVAQNIGVRIAPVEKARLAMDVRTVGVVAADETRVRDVTMKVSGWIEKLHVDWLGAPVEAGDPLFDLYSPDLYATQAEYVSALKSGSKELVEAARERLRFQDVADSEIEALAAVGKPSKRLTIRSPFTGIVLEKNALEGSQAMAGMKLFRLADLSRVWVMATVYEYQLPYLMAGARATMTPAYLPGQTFEGKVVYVYPTVDPKSREVQVRLEFDNPGQLLRPGMFARVDIAPELSGERVVVAREAVIDTGERQVAFVSKGDGRFEPRNVRLGRQARGKVEILEGLEPGEMVVTSGQFLIDSEARIREALARMIKGSMASEQKPAASGESELETLPPAAEGALRVFLDAVLTVGETLAADSMTGAAEGAGRVTAAIDDLTAVALPGDAHFWHRHEEPDAIRKAAAALKAAADLATARERYADLSAAAIALVKATGVPPSYGKDVHVLHCPMYRKDQGGTSWLQREGEAKNPYYGTEMLACFDAREALPVTGAAPDSSKAPASEAPAADPVAHTHVSAKAQAANDALIEAYLAVQAALARDSLDGVAERLAELRDSAGALGAEAPDVKDLAAKVAEAAGGGVAELALARRTFKALSGVVIALAERIPPALSGVSVRRAHCAMADADWLQREPEVRNPYYGKEMLTCGTITGTVARP